MEQNVEKLLRLLPRTGPSPDFDAAVFRRLETQPAQRRSPGLAAAAVVALLITALAGGQYLQMRRDEARLEALRAEQQRIAIELEELKKITAAYEPVLYVGGTDEIDLYLDLRETERAGSARNGIRPASTRTITDF